MTDETGGLKACASRDQEEILTGVYDLDDLADKRLEWGLFRDRRPEDVYKNNTIKFFKRTACLIFDLFLSMVYWYYLSKRAGPGFMLKGRIV